MKKVLFLLVSLLGLTQATIAQGPIWKDLSFYNTQGYNNTSIIESVNGFNYAASTFRSNLEFGDLYASSKGVQDLLIFKFDNNSNTAWKTIISPYYEWGLINPTALDIDNQGNVYIGVYYWGGINFNGDIIPDEFGNTALIKLNPEGNVEWIKPFFSSGLNFGNISFDSSSNVYFNNRSANLMKLNPAGEELWSKEYPNSTLKKVEVISDNLYIVGSLVGGNSYQFSDFTFDNLTRANTGFIARADLNGTFDIANTISSNVSSLNDIKQINNTIYLSGMYRQDLFLSNEFSRAEVDLGYYIFTAKSDLNLNFESLHSTNNLPTTNAVALFNTKIHSLSNGVIYITGNYLNNFEINDLMVEANGNDYLLKFDSNLNFAGAVKIPFHHAQQIGINSLDLLMLSGVALTGPNLGNFFVSTYDSNMNLVHNLNSVNSNYGTVADYASLQDNQGNYYLKTRYRGKLQMSGTTFYSEYDKTLITKHSADGTLQWFTEISDMPTDKFGSSFAFDKSGNIVNVGLFDINLQIGPFFLQEDNAGSQGYLTKISPNGSILWASSIDNGEVTKEMTLASDQNNNTIVSYMLSPNNYLVKFDASGNKIWSKEMYMESYYLSIVSTDINNNIFLASEIHLDNISPEGHTIQIDGITLTQNKNNSSTAVFKFDPDGNAQWAKLLGTNYSFDYSDGWPTAMKNDQEGNTYVWGWCRNNDQIGETLISNPYSSGSYHYFLTKLDLSGNYVWTIPVYQKLYGFNYGDLLEIDQSGDIYVAGSSRDSLMVGSESFANVSGNDVYIMKFRSDGEYKWTKKINQNRGLYISDISTGIDDELLVYGTYTNNSQFDDYYRPFTGGNNVFAGVLFDNYKYTKISLENTEATNGGDFSYHIYSESNDNIAPISYQFTLYYDPYTIEYQTFEINGTASESGDVVVNSNEWGKIYVSFMNEEVIATNAPLLELKFKAINYGETWLWIDDFYYNDLRIWNTEAGMVNITDFLLGDVDFNHMIQAYDGALVLQHSAGMDPLPAIDPLPWETRREEAANVDYDDRITANDAALILQYSARMIDWFAQPDDSTIAFAPIIENADVEVRYIDQQIRIKSYGNLIGLNLYAEKYPELLGIPNISNEAGLSVVNNENGNYAIAIANTTPLADGTEIISIPVEEENIDKVELHLIVNTQDKWIKGSVISSNTELKQSQSSYPNPFIDRIYIETQTGSKIELVDLQGRLIQTATSTGNRVEFNTSNLISGIYFIRIINSEGIKLEKIIKQ